MEHNELEEMREQMALLNQKLDKEEIVSDEAISEMTQKRIAKIQRRLIAKMIITPIIFFILLGMIGLVLGIFGSILYYRIYQTTKELKSADRNLMWNSIRVKRALKYNKIAKISAAIVFFCIPITVIVSFIYIGSKSLPDEPMQMIITVFYVLMVIIPITIAFYLLIDVIRKTIMTDKVEDVLSQVLEELEKE